MGKLLIGLGTWLLSDAIYSIMLYLNKPAYHGRKQTWARDHSIRLLRAMCAITIIIVGAIV